MADVEIVLNMLKEHDVKFVDFRFTDPRGKWHHLARHVRTIDEVLLSQGVMFDGSSIAGWKAANDSDMILLPDLTTALLDPFAAQTSLILVCDTHEPGSRAPYSRDPRATAKSAERYFAETGIGDKACFAAETQFFVFDDVRYAVKMEGAMYEVGSEEGPYSSDKEYPDGNTGHRPRPGEGYLPVPPVDSLADLRAEMLSVMAEMGLEVEEHHHERAASQNELGCSYSPLTRAADMMQICKYVVQNVAHQYGKSATFMPKPLKGGNGSGMHIHQSLWRSDRPIFAGNFYADLSELALYYIGGIIRHSKAINAFTNPTTNSYKRLGRGREAPVFLAYSSRNRSAACRIPYAADPKGTRVEVRYPDGAANPYLAYAALLMAGLDGIDNKIAPGNPIDKNFYELSPAEREDIPTVCGSLRDALVALEAAHAFLLKGGVFNEDQIEAYMELKWNEVYALEESPHPIEFEMYYSV